MRTATVNRVAWMVHDVAGCTCGAGIPLVAHVGRIADVLAREAGRRGFPIHALTSDQAAVLVDAFFDDERLAV